MWLSNKTALCIFQLQAEHFLDFLANRLLMLDQTFAFAYSHSSCKQKSLVKCIHKNVAFNATRAGPVL